MKLECTAPRLLVTGLLTATLLSAVLLLAPLPTVAQSPAVQGAASGIGVGDVTPAATLLLPYFEVDVNDMDGVNTRFWVHNARSESTVVNMVLWTDLGRPTLDIPLFLSGFDVIEVDLGAMFRDGAVPYSAPGLPSGPYSGDNVDFPACFLPLPANMPSTTRQFLEAAHTGNSAPAGFSQTGLCAGLVWGDTVARGFITLDVVNECPVLARNPLDEGYFADGGTGVASNDNAIWGEFAMTNLDGTQNAHAAPLVHIEAAGSVGEGYWDDGDYTFYSNAIGGSAVDNREPLATTWLVRWENDVQPEIQEASFLFYWRDVFGTGNEFFDCAGPTPFPFPMAATEEAIFNDSEDVTITDSSPFSPAIQPSNIALMPWAAGSVELGNQFDFFDQGWVWLNMNTVITGSASFLHRQSHVSVVYRRYSDFVQAGTMAVPFDNALVPNETFLNYF